MKETVFSTTTNMDYPSGVGLRIDYFSIEESLIPPDWDNLSPADKYDFLKEGGYWFDGYSTNVINEYGKIVDVDENGDAGEQSEEVLSCNISHPA